MDGRTGYGSFLRFEPWSPFSKMGALDTPIYESASISFSAIGDAIFILLHSKVSKLKLNKLKIILPIIKLTTIFNSLSRLTTLHIAFERY
jgi:hypothetical protein